MKIYTKTGDQGETSLVDGKRVPKTHPRVEAYGTVDELNAIVGMSVSFLNQHSLQGLEELKSQLLQIQNHLFNMGSHLACEKKELRERLPRIMEEHIHELEEHIDHMEETLPPLKNFILPGGSPAAAALHQARTVCRRAEREVLRLPEKEALSIQYLNRLSDYLFVAARFANLKAGLEETLWKK
jgi:cob(I)alamin adenosyltransferase